MVLSLQILVALRDEEQLGKWYPWLSVKSASGNSIQNFVVKI